MRRILDGTAIGLSALCMIHCLALPLAAAALPLAGQLAEAEWVHWAVLLAAAPVALFALSPAFFREPRIPGLGLAGIGLLTLGALDLEGFPPETVLSVCGGLFLAWAHLWNWRLTHRLGAGHAGCEPK